MAGGEFHEMSSKCNMFLDPCGFSSEDIASPFSIPRTSSIAKSNRPAVSFAEGTRFSPKERRGSAQDPKSPWGVSVLSALQGQESAAGEEDGGESEEGDDGVGAQAAANRDGGCEPGDQEVDGTPSGVAPLVPGASGRRRAASNAHKGGQPPPADAQTGVLNKLTTVYVTVGEAGKPASKAETSSEGPVQAMLRRIGSLQRQREQETGKAKPKGAEGIAKPPRRKLGDRASVWEEGGPPGGEVGICKPIRRKHDADAAAKRPPSLVLLSVPEAGSDLRSESGGPGTGKTEGTYLTVGPAVSLTEVVGVDDEPCYENVIFTHS